MKGLFTMIFDIKISPPTSTAQMKKVRIVNGHPVFYEPAKVKAAKQLLISALRLYKPDVPFTGAVQLTVIWLFPKGKSHKAGYWRTTRPDTDNLQKMLKDCMTKLGFWLDDALVVREIVEKRWADEPGGLHIEIQALPEVAA
jgi:Holliday junction resolvase RusA-like endonuclease